MTASVSGEIAILLGALDRDIFDEGGLRLLELAGPTYEDERFPGELYRTFRPSGVAVVYSGKHEKHKARAVFAYITPQDDAQAYLSPDRLIDGLALSTAGREGVREFFGEAALSTDTFDVYEVDGGFLHFEYDEQDELGTVTAMKEVPGL